MVGKVSDFKLAEAIIKKICRSTGSSFVDAPIDFDGTDLSALQVGETKNVAHTIYKIINEYLNNVENINGRDILLSSDRKKELLLAIASNLRYFIYKDGSEDMSGQPFVMRLYQQPLVWILLKDIVAPVFDVDINNVKLVYGYSPYTDISKFYSKEETNNSSNDDMIFVNNINNRVLQNIFIFVEALKMANLSPIEIIKSIYESDLYDKLHGLLEISLSEEDVNDFECGLLVILGIDFTEMLSNKVSLSDNTFVKLAQNLFPSVNGQWGFLGILEKMLEPSRGDDWSVYQALEPYVKEFWDRVEETKQKRVAMGKDPGVPFEDLLRLKSVQTVGYKIDTRRTMEQLLGSNRVW